MDWTNWSRIARKKPAYKVLDKEIQEIVSRYGTSVLDVGCGDKRHAKLFKDYTGIDQQNGFDLLKDDWNTLGQFDVAYTSLVLMLFNKEDATYIFSKMQEHAKTIVLFEECYEEREYSHAPDKYSHDYKSFGNLIACGISKKGPHWKWYVYTSSWVSTNN